MKLNYEAALIQEKLEEENPMARLYPEYEEALIGICRRKGMNPVALYNQKKCIEILMDRDGMSEEDALEYFDSNTLEAWNGENTPCFFDGEI